jgi:hypothetical protein
MEQAHISVLPMKDCCRSCPLAKREVQRAIDSAGPLFLPHCPCLTFASDPPGCLSPPLPSLVERSAVSPSCNTAACYPLWLHRLPPDSPAALVRAREPVHTHASPVPRVLLWLSRVRYRCDPIPPIALRRYRKFETSSTCARGTSTHAGKGLS